MVTREMAIESLKAKKEAEIEERNRFYEVSFKLIFAMVVAQAFCIVGATYVGVM